MKKLIIIFIVMLLFAAPSIASYGRWLNSKDIKTYIQPNHKNTVMMKHAFNEWSRLTKDKVIFRYVSSPEKADLKVSFVKKIDTSKYKNLDKPIGITYYNTHGNRIFNSQIQIADKTQDNRTLSKDEVYTTMLHEIGHSLGLAHTKNSKCIMYPEARVVLEICNEDLANLKKLYNWK